MWCPTRGRIYYKYSTLQAFLRSTTYFDPILHLQELLITGVYKYIYVNLPTTCSGGHIMERITTEFPGF